jgi:hypothetical protein
MVWKHGEDYKKSKRSSEKIRRIRSLDELHRHPWHAPSRISESWPRFEATARRQTSFNERNSPGAMYADIDHLQIRAEDDEKCSPLATVPTAASAGLNAAP